MMGVPCWEDRADEIRQMYAEGMSTREIADYYGVTPSAFRSRMAELRYRGVEVRGERPQRSLPVFRPQNAQSLNVEFPDKKRPVFDLDRYMDLKIREQEQLRDKGMSQKEATVNITTDQPFAVAFTADWHVGSAGVDYVTLFRHLQLIMNTPNLYFAAVGDMMDNFIKSKIKSAMLHSLFGPAEQRDVVEAIFRRVGDKCLFYTAGNHDDWTDGEAGIDIIESFSKGLVKAPYLRAGGGVNITFNEGVNYRIYAKHKFSMNSRLNRSHASKRMHELESPYDIGVLAHTHSPTVEHTERWSGAYGKDAIHITTGTYKVEDYFGASNGYGASALAVSPTVVLWPDTKRMVPFFHIEDAVTFLEAINGGDWHEDTRQSS